MKLLRFDVLTHSTLQSAPPLIKYNLVEHVEHAVAAPHELKSRPRHHRILQLSVWSID